MQDKLKMNHTKPFTDPQVLATSPRSRVPQDHQKETRHTPPCRDVDLIGGEVAFSSSRLRGVESVTPSPQFRGPIIDDRTRTEDENFHLPRTFVRPKLPQELLEQPYVISRKAGVNISVISPKHSGGGIIAGKLNISVRGDEKENNKLELGRVSVDLVGIGG